jgi:hypothetical protein
MLPSNRSLLGLNYNKGMKISLTLRYHGDQTCFLPLEELVDTMLHELSHNIWGPHDSNFHRLWDELRDEYDILRYKGYTGEGFLSKGRKLGGAAGSVSVAGRAISQTEIRHLARKSAEQRQAQGTLFQGSGQRLGGHSIQQHGGDIRAIIAQQTARRIKVDRGCASVLEDAKALSEQTSTQSFQTSADEDDTNDRAIAEALAELMEEEEMERLRNRKLPDHNPSSLSTVLAKGTLPIPHDRHAGSSLQYHDQHPSEEEQLRWAMQASVETAKSVIDTTSKTHGDELEKDSSLAPDPHLNISTTETKGAADQIKLEVKALSPELHSGIKRVSSPIDLTGEPESEVQLSKPTKLDDSWACQVCTYVNTKSCGLACEVCGTERKQKQNRPKKPNFTTGISRGSALSMNPQRRTMSTKDDGAGRFEKGWTCTICEAVTEHRFWSCHLCGTIKKSS